VEIAYSERSARVISRQFFTDPTAAVTIRKGGVVAFYIIYYGSRPRTIPASFVRFTESKRDPRQRPGLRRNALTVGQRVRKCRV